MRPQPIARPLDAALDRLDYAARQLDYTIGHVAPALDRQPAPPRPKRSH